MPRRHWIILSLALLAATQLADAALAANPFTLEQILAPAYPSELVAARKADRIAWIAYDRGLRNVYTAAGPEFKPVRVTNFNQDDGVDLTGLIISDDGAVVTYVRGHTANSLGWVANPASDPRGVERATWAASTQGGAPRKVALTGNPVLSPDGRWVLFVKEGQFYRAAVDPKDAQSDADRGTQPFFVVHGVNSNPHWSPNSSKIAFVSNRTDHSFIGVYDCAQQKISYLAPGVDHDSSPTWSPDSRQVAFIRRPGTPFGQQERGGTRGATQPGRGRRGGQQAAPAQAPAIPPARFPETNPPGFTNRLLPGGQASAPAQAPAFSTETRTAGLSRGLLPGGATLAFYVADVVTGKGREFWHNAPDERTFTTIDNIQWAGDAMLFTRPQEEWSRYYVVPIAGGVKTPVLLPTGDGLVENISLSDDGKYLYFSSNVTDIDRRHLWRVPITGGPAEQLTSGHDIECNPVVLASGSEIALFFAGPKHPKSVAVMPATRGKPRIIFPDFKGFPFADQVVPENVLLKAADGREFHNQLFLPAGLKPGERRPAIIFVHGGPMRQMLLGYHYMFFYHMAYAVNQYLANEGYVVLSVNYRSGIGYGRSFQTAPKVGRAGNSEYQDVLAAGEYLRGRPDVDPQRIGIWGLSYGGLLTAQALARNSEVFCAGVDMAGVHLWGDPLNPTDVAYQSSPSSQIDKWKSPVLLIHGDDDRNVAFSQTTGLVQLLRAHNIYHELIVFPDDVHDFLLDHRWMTALHATDDFLKRFVKERKAGGK
jgi:dipeptidyl aminopeptidase/acylaminoacyl peptidase